MNVCTHVGYGFLVVDNAPQQWPRPLTPTATKIAVGQDNTRLRLDALLGNVLGDTLDHSATTTLGLGRAYELI